MTKHKSKIVNLCLEYKILIIKLGTNKKVLYLYGLEIIYFLNQTTLSKYPKFSIKLINRIGLDIKM